MLRTYIHIAFKYLIRQPAYSILSILGFTLAFASIFLIYSHVSYQHGYDKHVTTWKRVYRLSGEIDLPDNENIHALLGPKLGPVMKEEMPAVEEMARLVPFQEKCIVTRDNQSCYEEEVYFADSTIFELFPIPFLYGSPEHSLHRSGQVVISESTAMKYFGRTNVLDEELEINHAQSFVVSGIISDLPDNVHHDLHMLVSMSSFNSDMQRQLASENSENFWRPSAYTFIMLGENNRIEEVEKAFPALFDTYMAEFGNFLKADFQLILTPLADLHFTPQYAYDLPKGNRSYQYLLTGAGIFLLIIALLNYTNLFSASVATRTRSLGIFKINGAARSHLYKLLITESAIIIVFSAVLAWFILTGLESSMESWLGGSMLVTGFSIGSFLLLTLIVIVSITLAFLVSVLSKIYRKPITLLEGDPARGWSRNRQVLGKGGIIFQFTLSTILIISSLFITRYVNALLKSDLGYNTDNVVQVQLHAEQLPIDRVFSFKNELIKSPLISQAAYSSNIPGEPLGTVHFKLDVDGTEASKIVSLMAIDADYIPLMQMELKEGRNFDREHPTDQGGVILNQACIRFLGMGDQLAGKRIRDIEIIGVLKNGSYNSLHEETRPVAFYYEIGPTGYMNIKLSTHDLPQAMEYIRKTYDTFFEGIPFESSFLDLTVEQMYRNDLNQSNLLTVFTLLSIVLANIGLFGLVALLNRKRIREIGIRKVNGAQKWQIAMMLGRQLLYWVGIAVIIAVPVTWYITGQWVQNFAIRTPFSWWLVPAGGIIILLSAVLTTGLITLRAAGRNPVETLRYE
jgi:putative ABC transport system permease protein